MAPSVHHLRLLSGQFSKLGSFFGVLLNKGAVLYWGTKEGPYFRELPIWGFPKIGGP